MTVLENLEMGAMLPRARAGFRSGSTRSTGFFPRLRERTRQLAGTLSGGEQQMVAIGRCLMGPELTCSTSHRSASRPIVVRRGHANHLLLAARKGACELARALAQPGKKP